jgi:hypothetical protein
MRFRARLIVAVCFLAVASRTFADEQPALPSSPPTDAGTVHAGDVTFWLDTSLKRVFPQTLPGSTKLELIAARNSKIAFQACFRNNGPNVVQVDCDVREAADLSPQVRFVGLTPVPHVTPETPRGEIDGAGKFVPGLVPDPLWPAATAELCSYESRSFWVTLNIPETATPGNRTLRVRLTLKEKGKENRAVELPVHLRIAPLVRKPREGFPVTHWWWPHSNRDQYKTEMFDERWWRITRAQMENMREHGCDVVYVPMFFFAFPRIFEEPGQLLIVREPAPGVYQFDWSRVKRFTDMCREVGFSQFEWSHLFRQWGVDQPPLVYKLDDGKYVNLWPVEEPLLSAKYTSFLKQLLPEFKRFLDEEQLLQHSYFHLSDEPQSIGNYRAAREFLRRESPWMKVMDAVQDVQYAQRKLTDMPVPLINVAKEYAAQDIPHWVYFCCIPTGEYLNRFMDTRLPKIRMSGWTFYRLRAKGFLHWGFNFWNDLKHPDRPVDPFHDASAGGSPFIPAGDPFVIYPGPDERPLDSIRWEVFAESLQDYALLQSAGVNPDDELLAEIKSYKDFPKTEKWLDETRRRILLGPAR